MSGHQAQDAGLTVKARVHIEKDYFTLAETCNRWGVSEEDIIYLAVHNKIVLSVLVFDEKITIAESLANSKYKNSTNLQGSMRDSVLLDIYPPDVFKVFRCGEARLDSFQTENAQYIKIGNAENRILVLLSDLVLKREERERYELESGFAADGGFVASRDYRDVSCNGYSFKLGFLQAAVVRELHKAALAGEPWQSGKEMLARVGSKSVRIADLFRSQPNWRELIESDHRGMYRLKVDHFL